MVKSQKCKSGPTEDHWITKNKQSLVIATAFYSSTLIYRTQCASEQPQLLRFGIGLTQFRGQFGDRRSDSQDELFW